MVRATALILYGETGDVRNICHRKHFFGPKTHILSHI